MYEGQTLGTHALGSFGTELKAAVIGATGGIGGAFLHHIKVCPAVSKVVALSRSSIGPDDDRQAWLYLDLESEETIADAAAAVKRSLGTLQLVIVATGILHDGDRLQPEKSWRAMTGTSMEWAFRLNTIGPALVAKHFLPLLSRDRKAVFAALSARVGSIEDNHLGGWYAYRASKAALNMVIKSLSIELARRNPFSLCIGLHPGTVDTGLSKPFQAGVPTGKLFPAETSARYLLDVIDSLGPEDSGHVYAWDGTRIPF